MEKIQETISWTESKPAVGLRLQDVLLRLETPEPPILCLRRKILARRETHPGEDEREAVLQILSLHLVGTTLTEAKTAAQQTLKPYHDNGDQRKTLIVSGASSASASQETECAILEARGHVIDIPGAIEGRDTRSAQAGNVALISTRAGLMMAQAKGDVEIINLADEVVLPLAEGTELKGADLYYKADSLLLLMLTNPDSSILSQIFDQLARNVLVYPYNLDEETQLALLTLARRSGIGQLDVNANSPEVAVQLTRKGYKYPRVEDALKVPYQEDPCLMQKTEWQLSQSAQEIGHHPDSVPGYVISKSENSEQVYQNLLTACMLLASRYHLPSGWLKPDRGTDGGSQGPLEVNIPTSIATEIIAFLEAGEINQALQLYETAIPNSDSIRQKAAEMHQKGGSWVIEAKTHYFALKFPFNGQERVLMTTPSVHVIKGEPRYTISLQLVDGVAWGGNLICSYETWSHLVDGIDLADDRIISNPQLKDALKQSYNLMTEAMRAYVEKINNSPKYHQGQVRGGADLAICTLGGKFGHDKIMIAVQDYNARANGCETAYALYDQAQVTYAGKGEAVTRNITPKVGFDAFSKILPLAIEQVNQTHGKNITSAQVKLIAVSAGWGQMGIMGTDAFDILQSILLIEEQLRQLGVVQ